MSGNLIAGTQRLFHTWTKGERKNATDMMRVGGLVSLSNLEEEEKFLANSVSGGGGGGNVAQGSPKVCT